jgi:transcriptional regulator with XRE-family HTH domain
MLAVRIAQLRKKHGMSQLELASVLHISPSAEGMYEQGRRTPSLDILVEMSLIFRVSLDYLITGSEFTGSQNISEKMVAMPFPCGRCCCSTCSGGGLERNPYIK